jgi:hypothetical protein
MRLASCAARSAEPFHKGKEGARFGRRIEVDVDGTAIRGFALRGTRGDLVPGVFLAGTLGRTSSVTALGLTVAHLRLGKS